MIHFLKRYYNPVTGRWLTTDPLGFADGPNLYAYVHNNPLGFVDPYGLWGESVTSWGKDRGNAFKKGAYNMFKDPVGTSYNNWARIGNGHIWQKASPFKGKSEHELHQMFAKKGYEWRPRDPDKLMKGLGNYINPKNGRQYYIEPRNFGRYREPNFM